jgi:hypothetical protein
LGYFTNYSAFSENRKRKLKWKRLKPFWPKRLNFPAQNGPAQNETWPVTEPAARRLKWQRLGPSKPPPTWAEFGPNQRWSFISDRRRRAIFKTTKSAWRGASHQTLVHSLPPRLCLHPSEQANEVADAPTDRRSGAVAHLLAGGRCSPKGERAVIEQLRCDTLSRKSEPINLRVGVGEPQVPFPDSDEAGSGDGKPR